MIKQLFEEYTDLDNREKKLLEEKHAIQKKIEAISIERKNRIAQIQSFYSVKDKGDRTVSFNDQIYRINAYGVYLETVTKVEDEDIV